jgi:hypothetical protein
MVISLQQQGRVVREEQRPRTTITAAGRDSKVEVLRQAPCESAHKDSCDLDTSILRPALSSGSTQAASSVEERRSVSTPSALLLGGRGGGGGGPAGHAAHFGREARAAFFALWREQGHISATDGDHAPRQIDSARRAYLSSALPQTATPERAAAASIIMGRVNE